MQYRAVSLFSLPLFLAALWFLPSDAHAQSRAGRVAFGLETQAAVFLGPDRAWIPGGLEERAPSALCSEVMCRPVVRIEACITPRCPGDGRMVWSSEHVASVSNFPEDRQGFIATLGVLAQDPAFVSVTPFFGAHPEPPPTPPRTPRFSTRGPGTWGLELDASGGIATGLVHVSSPMWEVAGFFSFRHTRRRPREDGLDWMFGRQFGPELRVRVIGNVTGQSETDMAIFMGIGLASGMLEDDERWRVPPLYSWIGPEVGVVVRTDWVPPAFYMGWSIPFSALVDDHFGFQARANLLFIDDWYAGDDAEVIVSLSAEIVLR